MPDKKEQDFDKIFKEAKALSTEEYEEKLRMTILIAENNKSTLAEVRSIKTRVFSSLAAFGESLEELKAGPEIQLNCIIYDYHARHMLFENRRQKDGKMRSTIVIFDPMIFIASKEEIACEGIEIIVFGYKKQHAGFGCNIFALDYQKKLAQYNHFYDYLVENKYLDKSCPAYRGKKYEGESAKHLILRPELIVECFIPPLEFMLDTQSLKTIEQYKQDYRKNRKEFGVSEVKINKDIEGFDKQLEQNFVFSKAKDKKRNISSFVQSKEFFKIFENYQLNAPKEKKDLIEELYIKSKHPITSEELESLAGVLPTKTFVDSIIDSVDTEVAIKCLRLEINRKLNSIIISEKIESLAGLLSTDAFIYLIIDTTEKVVPEVKMNNLILDINRKLNSIMISEELEFLDSVLLYTNTFVDLVIDVIGERTALEMMIKDLRLEINRKLNSMGKHELQIFMERAPHEIGDKLNQEIMDSNLTDSNFEVSKLKDSIERVFSYKKEENFANSIKKENIASCL